MARNPTYRPIKLAGMVLAVAAQPFFLLHVYTIAGPVVLVALALLLVGMIGERYAK